MRILIAPDKFKGSLSAYQACMAIQNGILKADPNFSIDICPLADGGDGTIDVISNHLEARRIFAKARDPLGRSIETSYLMSGETAYIEMASASGLVLLEEEEQNPLFTSTYGTGELMMDAITRGAKEIYLFVGGSATTDMGIGMAQALGYAFIDKDNQEVPPVGVSMPFIMEIKKKLKYDPELIRFFAVCDVDNPLYGENGAAYVYAQQKGADSEAVEMLDKGLRKLSKRCQQYLDRDVSQEKGGGAAGGIGAGVIAFLDGQLISGIEFMLDLAGLEAKVKKADLVITGEGKIDAQTLHGKTINGVAQLAQQYNKPLWVLAGSSDLSKTDMTQLGIQKLGQIMSRATSLQDAMGDAGIYLETIAYDMMREQSPKSS